MTEGAQSIQGDLTLGELQTSIAAAYNKSQFDEHKRIRKILNFVCKCDEIDESVVLAVTNILWNLPRRSGDYLLIGDVLNVIYSLPAVEILLHPEFFNSATLPFRLLRRSLEIHLVNPVSEEGIWSILLSEDDRNDPRLAEIVWYLLFIGASAHAIFKNLN